MAPLSMVVPVAMVALPVTILKWRAKTYWK